MSNETRVENRDKLDAELGKAIAAFDRKTVIGMLERAGVSCGPINDISEVFGDVHVRARGMRVDQYGPDSSRISSTAFPVKLSKTPAHYHTAPPLLGEHNDDVLKDWVGLSDQAIAALRDARAI